MGSLRPSHTSSHIAEAGGLAQLRRDVPETDCTLVVIIVGLTLLRLTLREPSPNRGSDECRARGEVTAIDPNADIARLAQGRPPPPQIGCTWYRVSGIVREEAWTSSYRLPFGGTGSQNTSLARVAASR